MRISAICASLLTLSALWASPVYAQNSQGSFCRPVAQFENGILKADQNPAMYHQIDVLVLIGLLDLIVDINIWTVFSGATTISLIDADVMNQIIKQII